MNDTKYPYGIGPLADHVQAAEPCTELGADDEDPPMQSTDRALLFVLGVASVSIVSAFMWHVFAAAKYF